MTQIHKRETSASVQPRIGYPSAHFESNDSPVKPVPEIPYFPAGKRFFVKPFSVRPKPILLDWSLGGERQPPRPQQSPAPQKSSFFPDWMTDE